MQEEMNKLKELHESLEMNYSDYNLVVAWSKLDEFENLVSSIRRNHEIEKLNINLNLWISDIRNLKNKYRQTAKIKDFLFCGPSTFLS